jgi:hypothetical protein
MAPLRDPRFTGGRTFVQSELHCDSDQFDKNELHQIRKDYTKMTPNQQIIPGPRLPEGRNPGRSTAIELSRPGGSHRSQPEATVNYSALIRRHRNAIAMIMGGTLLLSVLYTLVAHKVYKSEVILEVTGIAKRSIRRITRRPATNTSRRKPSS